MNSPDKLKERLTKRWQSNQARTRYLLDPHQWPMVEPIPKPPPRDVRGNLAGVRRHLDAWRTVTVGKVEWEATPYQATGEPIEVPRRWVLDSPQDWVAATGNQRMAAEYAVLMDVLAAAPNRYHKLLVRQRRLLSHCSLSDIVTILSFADGITPGAAEGAPLRAVAWPGADTKLYERNRALLVALLDVRFDGQVSKLGLERFLGAAEGDGHWLLVADLDGELLRYPRLRLTENDLERHGLPGDRMLAVENEQCFHVLPPSPGTVAVLGAGLNTRWLASSAFDSHQVGYWGDLDTWGLKMLADARTARPTLTSLMMDRITFDMFASRAVPEPQLPKEPIGLTPNELKLFQFLSDLERGRLEQELLPTSWVADAVARWRVGGNETPAEPGGLSK